MRVPFNHKLIETRSYHYEESGFLYLDKLFSWAEQYKLGIILDLHAACGAQSCDWHADSRGKAKLWTDRTLRERTVALWQVIVERYKDKKALVGYDVLNEPVLGSRNDKVLKTLYKKIIKAIKEIDSHHIIFLEGSFWAQRIDFLKDLIEDNIAISIHTYQPLEFTFNFNPCLRFPGRVGADVWNKKTIYKHLESYFKFSQKNKIGIFVGEFGINWRGGLWGEVQWLSAILKAFSDFGFGYTYWTYKAMANNVFPDGLYQQIDNSTYINRQGPIYGWETYLDLWRKEKNKIIEFWRTENFTPNRKLISTLRRYFKK